MKNNYFLFVLLFSLSIIYAQQGKLDIRFNTKDDGLLGDGFDGTVNAISLYSDNKLLVGGNFNNFNGTPAAKICRLDSEGQIDASFLSGSGFNENVYCMLPLSNGHTLIGGNFTTYNGKTVSKLVKIDANGNLDESFSTKLGDIVKGIIYSLAEDNEGKIIIVGSFDKINTTSINRVARLLPDGTLDTSFLIGKGASLLTKAIAIQPDNKILLGGNFDTFSGESKSKLVRLHSDGTIDNSFTIGTGFNEEVEDLVIQPDGKILVGGNFTTYNNIAANKIIRLNIDGTIDNSFASGSGFDKGIVYKIALDGNGNILVGGSFNGNYDGIKVNRLLMLQDNGKIKSEFDIADGPSAALSDIAHDQNGFWYLGGNFTTYDGLNQGRVTKINEFGALEDGYLTPNVGFNLPVYRVLPLPDKKVLVGGSFKKFNGTSTTSLVCLEEDGTMDSNFNAKTSGVDNVVRAMLQLPDEKILVGGAFKTYNGVNVGRIVAINADGTLDNSIHFGTGFNNHVYCIARQSDGKFIIGGNFTSFNNEAANHIIRLNSDGSRDTSFNCLGTDKIIEEILIQPDGKIIVVGRFGTFNDATSSRMVRLNENGSTDTSFNVGTGFGNNIYAAALQPDGKIIVGGSFTTYMGFNQKKIARLNSDGSLDASFSIGAGFSKGDLRSIILQKDGKIVVGGTFTGTYSSKEVSRLLRLKSDGKIDESFSANLNGTLYTMAFTADNKLMIGGNFNSVSGKAKHRIARLRLCINSSEYNGNWSNQTATDGMELTFNQDFQISQNLNACSCKIAEGKKITIAEEKTLSLDFDLSGLGTLILQNKASLYQDDNEVVNSGKIIAEKKSTPMKNFDYTYWSSPVANQNFKALSPNTYPTNYYYWNNGWIFWTGIMKPGKGYICTVPRPGNYTNGEKAFEANSLTYEQPVKFEGIPNNGIILGETTVANRFHLVGNPYPSAISANEFLDKNPFLFGTIYLWTHDTPLQLKQNVKVYNAADYALYNRTGSTITGPKGVVPTGKIASGQGFFVSAKAPGTVFFSNEMRVKNQNNLFFKRTEITSKTTNNTVKLWLDLTNSQGAFKQLLIGYVPGATNEFDDDYDGISFNGNTFINFFSIANEKKYTIQGRQHPFTLSDEIELGYTSEIEGAFSITIHDLEGFSNQDAVFLEDKLLHREHNLQKGSYNFETSKGTFTDRFVLRFQSNLNLNEIEKKESIVVYSKEKSIWFSSEKEAIKEVFIYDLSGKLLFCKKEIYTNEYNWNFKTKLPAVVLSKMKLETNKVVTQKVILN
ncbi:calcium-binding protein [Flavobacterium agrisoli]|uniref:Calcium-binding protein n=1 Tax=Flavobacterium agrisoli TaxID=2793066 RepID=A0A934UIZ8_9FLAO|nr:calcium-binding protein [Flavobacterium agrisoli]MBK0369436.1 calcium-binding protein [Flavobacterium agrisoli]